MKAKSLITWLAEEAETNDLPEAQEASLLMLIQAMTITVGDTHVHVDVPIEPDSSRTVRYTITADGYTVVTLGAEP